MFEQTRGAVHASAIGSWKCASSSLAADLFRRSIVPKQTLRYPSHVGPLRTYVRVSCREGNVKTAGPTVQKWLGSSRRLFYKCAAALARNKAANYPMIGGDMAYPGYPPANPYTICSLLKRFAYIQLPDDGHL